MRLLTRLLLPAILIACVGCGGGGGGTPQATPTGATIRQIKAGDQAIYSGNGTIVAQGLSVPVAVALTLTTYADTTTPSYGTRAFRQVAEFTFTSANGSFYYTTTGYLEQGTNGTLYALGSSNSGGNYKVVTSVGLPIGVRSPVIVGDTWSYVAHYADGSIDTNDTSVVALENVNGQMAYRTHSTSTGSGKTSTEDDWFVPNWGFYLRSKLALQTQEGQLLGTVTLVSKNF